MTLEYNCCIQKLLSRSILAGGWLGLAEQGRLSSFDPAAGWG
jgi:hypothetical protein